MLFLKLLAESFFFSIHALRSNKLRTLLSLLGISIGIFAIISVFTVLDSFEAQFRTSVASLGNNVIYVQKWPWSFDSDMPWWDYMKRPLPSYKEYEDVQRRINSAQSTAFVIFLRNRTVKYKNNNVENAQVMAVTQGYEKIKSFELKEGRFFTEQETNGGKPVAVIGANVVKDLFPFRSPVGETINILGRKVTIIGEFKKEGTGITIGNSLDEDVVIPVNYARTMIDMKSERVQPMIMVKGKEGVGNEELIDELKGIMRNVRKLAPKEKDNFALNQASLITAGLESVFSIINKAGWLIGGFSILVGGFGIANIMFVSVKERTSIIGIQMSLGAKGYFILLQFLVEAVILCLFGGMIGLIGVFLGTLLLNGVSDMHISLTGDNISLGLFVSAIIGVVSGFTPAFRASQMDPVEAIRSN